MKSTLPSIKNTDSKMSDYISYIVFLYIIIWYLGKRIIWSESTRMNMTDYGTITQSK